MYRNNNDLEVGSVFVSKKVKKVVDFYRKNEGRVKHGLYASFFLTIALIIKLAFHNFDTVIEHAPVITFDEDTYTPFKMTKEIIPKVESKSSIQFPIKESQVNWKIQTLNLLQSRKHALEYGYLCVHLRHFNVPYDILIFDNITMVNPVVVSESEETKNIKEMSLDGTSKRVKRPVWIKVKYHDESLSKVENTLWYDYAACFAHYEY